MQVTGDEGTPCIGSLYKPRCERHYRPFLLPAVLITEDASVDARFSGNPYVAGEPRIKFYAGAPLVGTGKSRWRVDLEVDTELGMLLAVLPASAPKCPIGG